MMRKRLAAMAGVVAFSGTLTLVISSVEFRTAGTRVTAAADQVVSASGAQCAGCIEIVPSDGQNW
jgi:hypothetical protein